MTTLQLFVMVTVSALGAIIALTHLYRRAWMEEELRPDGALAEPRHPSARPPAGLIEPVEGAHALELRWLDAAQRRPFRARWDGVQRRFVDSPERAVREASALIACLLEARGYPEAGWDQRLRDVSAHHPHLVDHLRRACLIAQSPRPSTEQLRQALLHQRVVLDDLLDGPLRLRRPGPRGAGGELDAKA
jgi:hypothetical protein